jgi:glutamyl/glutaminyl-tRNA synthetase
MHSDPSTQGDKPNRFSSEEVETIVRERGWLSGERPAEARAWLEQAAALLGPQAADPAALAGLLGLIFQYDAAAILRSPEAHTVLAREGAREVIRELAHRVLEGAEVDSDRFKEIITALKEKTGRRGRELFHPIRLALAGRAGEGDLDRVILLLDAAAKRPFAAPVKGARQRMLEFCSALD